MRRVYVAIICLCLVMCAVFGTLFVKEVFFSGSASGGASTDDEARTDKNVDVTLEPGKHMVLELSEGDEKRLSSWKRMRNGSPFPGHAGSLKTSS